MEHRLKGLLDDINESTGDIEGKFDELDRVIVNIGFNSLPSSIVDDLIEILNRCVKDNEDKPKQDNIKEMNPNSFISDLYDNYANCSKYELELHKLVNIMTEIVQKSKSSLNFSESSIKIILLLIKNLKLYIRFLLIDFLNILLNSNNCPRHSLTHFHELYEVLYKDLQCHLSINMKNSIYNLLITMIINHPLEWKNKCKSIAEKLFVLLLSLITIEIKVYYDDIERIHLQSNTNTDRNTNTDKLVIHQQYDNKCIEIINKNIKTYLHFIEFCICELVDEESSLHFSDSDISLIQSKLLDISSFIIGYLKKVLELNKYNDNNEYLMNYTVYSIKLIGLFMKECYVNLIPSIYDIFPLLFSQNIIIDKSKENTINECTEIYVLPCIFNIIDDEKGLTVFLNNKGMERLYELIKYFYEKYLKRYSIESETAISEIYLIMNIINDMKERGIDSNSNKVNLSLFFNMLQSLMILYEEDDCLIHCLFGYILIFIFNEMLKENVKNGTMLKMKNEEKEILQRSIKLFENRLKSECDEMLISKYEEDESKIHELLKSIL